MWRLIWVCNYCLWLFYGFPGKSGLIEQFAQLHILIQVSVVRIWLKVPFNVGAPVAQWVKRWPTDLAVPSSSPARGEIFSTVKWVPLHAACHYHSLLVLIWLKHCWKGRKSQVIHPSIPFHVIPIIINLYRNLLQTHLADIVAMEAYSIIKAMVTANKAMSPVRFLSSSSSKEFKWVYAISK